MSEDTTIGGPPEIPGFRYEADLGHGGFAAVYRYEQTSLARSVAIKVLHGLSDQARAQFRAEAHVMARLSNHPSIVSIHQVGEAADGRPYLVMELCPPPHLGTVLREAPFTVADTLDLGVQLAGAVETAHRLGVLHRDIKPANILFTEFGRPVLADFGIARSAAVDTTIHAYSPAWAPPEQVRHGTAAPTADVYALCGTLWAMLAGRGPHEDSSPDADADAVPALERPDVPAALEGALRRGLDPRPSARFGTALELARELQRVQSSLGLPVTRVELWAGEAAPAPASAAPAAPSEDDRTHLVELAPTEPEPDLTLLDDAVPGEPVLYVATDATPPPAAPAAAGSPAPASAGPAASPPVASVPPAPVAAARVGDDLPERRRPGRSWWLLALLVALVVALVAILPGVLNPGDPPPARSSSTPAAPSTSPSPTPLPTDIPIGEQTFGGAP